MKVKLSEQQDFARLRLTQRQQQEIQTGLKNPNAILGLYDKNIMLGYLVIQIQPDRILKTRILEKLNLPELAHHRIAICHPAMLPDKNPEYIAALYAEARKYAFEADSCLIAFLPGLESQESQDIKFEFL